MSLDDSLVGLPPFIVVLWEKFTENPRILYDMFPREDDDLTDQIIDMTDDEDRQIKVENEEDLFYETMKLLTKPILLYVHLEHTRTDNYVVFKVTKTWSSEFAVLVNTQHEGIREVMFKRLLKARDEIAKGKRFCIKFNFEKSVRDWFNRSVDDEYCNCGYLNKDLRINCSNTMVVYIHNCTIPLSYCMNPCCIFWCFPFWLSFEGSCYFVWRKIRCKDIKENFRILPVIMLTAPLPTLVLPRQQRINHRVPGGRRVTPMDQLLRLNDNNRSSIQSENSRPENRRAQAAVF